MKECGKCNLKKDWNGSDIQCPFSNSMFFNEDNWNCGIVSQIRDICDYAANNTHNRLHYVYCDDMKYCIIDTFHILENSEEDTKADLGYCLFVKWYKNRGGTDQMMLMGTNTDFEIRTPTFKDLKLISDYYKKELNLQF